MRCEGRGQGLKEAGGGRASPAGQLGRRLDVVLYLRAVDVHGLSLACGRQTRTPAATRVGRDHFSLGSPTAEREKRHMGKGSVWEEIRVDRGAGKMNRRARHRRRHGSSLPLGPPGTICLEEEGSGHLSTAPGPREPRVASGAVLSPGRWAKCLERIPGQKWKGSQCELEVRPCHTDGSAQPQPKARWARGCDTGHHRCPPRRCGPRVCQAGHPTEELFLQLDGGLGRF